MTVSLGNTKNNGGEVMSFWKNLFGQKDKMQDTLCFDEKIISGLSGERRKIELAALSPGEYQSLTFLVAEDNPDQQQIMIEFLQQYGASVDSADNGQIALDMYRHGQDKYDMIFMDIEMPILDGKQAAEQIRQIGTESAHAIPIIGISGNLADEVSLSHFSLYLNKPFALEELAAIIQDFQ